MIDTASHTLPAPLVPLPAVRSESVAISAAFAHRVADEDVLVTGWTQRGNTSFALDIDWSGPHVFFAPARGSAHHHMLIAQTLRQVGLGLVHAALGVSRSHHFLMNDLTYSIDARHRVDPSAPLRAYAHGTWTGRRSLEMHIGLHQRGAAYLTSRSSFTWVPDPVYRRLRGERLTAVPPQGAARPVAPRVVGRDHASEVALAPGARPGTWQLIADTGHPALIDHAVDHVPGLVLLEAAQQAAYAFRGERGFDPTALALTAHRYVEFDAPCLLEAREVPASSPGSAGIEVVGRQREEITFRCLMQGSAVRP
ncbi:ScbA/BarX family gamma-butyrolactone biosynthesis protein [Streptomyces sp. NPDC049590]|uniref:ScbA/BarX family gamma-butyrolactone biosynthesis protein n=1 Tax=Streptomyces sp. NPDC049590 TaxID=3154834 RepID=UPI00342079DD